MQQRRSTAGRPLGTDGSDYSYRMVVDSRYTKVGKYKSRLAPLLLIQGLILVAGVVLKLFPLTKGEDPSEVAFSSVIPTLFALAIGESGRRRSRSSSLKIYLIFSLIAMLLSVAYAMYSNILLKVLQRGVAKSWEIVPLELFEAVHVVTEAVVLIFAAITTLSLIKNMSPPKRSS